MSRMSEEGEPVEHEGDPKQATDDTAGWLFAQDLTAYAGEWVAAIPGRVLAHAEFLKDVRAKLPAKMSVHQERTLRFYAIPGELQTT